MSRLRVSAISFLNTAPLMWDFAHGESSRRLAEHFDVTYTLPAKCADQLKAGECDLGIIPVAAFTTVPDLLVVPGVAIACKERVRSILLISKVPLEKIRSVATDDSSRTSAVLVEIYLRKFVGTDPGFSRQKPNLDEMLRWHDAALLIGDPALQASSKGMFVYDLAEQWRQWTGRPFVFAFWAVRQSALRHLGPDLNIPLVFQQSRDNGLKHIPEIAADWAAQLQLPEQLLREYLTQNVDYSLDSDNIEGLRLFLSYAAELNLLPPAPELRFVEQPDLAARI